MTYHEILQIFLDFPTRIFALREIARIAKINPNTVSKYISILEKKGLIKIQKTYLSLQISANRDSLSYIAAKRANILQKLMEANILQIMFSNDIELQKKITIVLIGNSARGIDIETDIVDLVFIGEKPSTSALKKLLWLEKELNRKINVINDSGKINSKNYDEIINGIIICGTL